MKQLRGSFVAVAVAACVSSGEVEGTIAGATLSLNDGALFVQTRDGQTETMIVLASLTKTCETARANKDRKGVEFLILTLQDSGAGAAVTPTPGEYNIVSDTAEASGKHAFAMFGRNEANSCESALVDNDGRASSGRVIVTKYDAAIGAEGSFELNFAAGEKVEGSFDVAACPLAAPYTAASCE